MARDFFTQIEQARKRYERRMASLHKKICSDLFRRVILKTPVDTDQARGNWMLGINVVPISVSDDADGDESLRNVITGLQALKPGDTAVLANSVPHIGVLEYGGYPDPPKNPTGKTVGGYSIQAPQGMVRITVEEYRPTLNRAIKEAKKETR